MSALSPKVSLPLMVMPLSAGGLTSRITSLPLAISTLSPAAGTFLLGQVAASDQRVAFAGAAAWTTADTLPSSSAGTSDQEGPSEFVYSHNPRNSLKPKHGRKAREDSAKSRRRVI